MDEAAKALGLVDKAGWYSISNQRLKELGGKTLLNRYNGSLSAILNAVYPEVAWQPSLFASLPRNYWKSESNRKRFMDELGAKLGIIEKEREGWYKVSSQTLSDHGGSALYKEFHGSMLSLLQATYPEVAWDPLKFNKAPQNYWSDEKTQRAFMEEISPKLGVKELSDWYKVSNQLLVDHGASGLLTRYGGSLSALLAKLYPDYKWDPMRFSQVPRNYWRSIENQRAYLDSILPKLGMKKGGDLEGWYKVTTGEIEELGGGALLKLYQGSLPALLAKVYPDYEWNLWRYVVQSSQSTALS